MNRKVNFDILESLRGMAALYVCIGHSRGLLWIGGEHYLKLHPKESLTFTDYLVLGLNMLTRLSSEFVIVFFVLSGFSIAHSLRKSTDAVSFYKRRFIRLYPPYLMALFWAMLVMWILQAAVPHFTDGTYQTPVFDRLADSRQLFDWKVIIKNLIYLPQLGGILHPFWSLTLEVIFYLLAPFLVRKKSVFYILSSLLFIAVLVNKRFNLISNGILTTYLYHNIFFMIGMLLYDHFDQVRNYAKRPLASKTPWVALGLFLLMVVLSLNGLHTTNAFIAALMSVILIVYLLEFNIEIKWLIAIGRFSYTLYITHFPTIFIYLAAYFTITNAAPPYIYNPLVFIPCIFFCLAVAYGQYWLVEKRSKTILDKLRRGTSKQAAKPEVTPSVINVEKGQW